MRFEVTLMYTLINKYIIVQSSYKKIITGETNHISEAAFTRTDFMPSTATKRHNLCRPPTHYENA